MENLAQQESKVKEIFMADVQQNSRPCTLLHCPYIIEPVSQFQVLPADTVTDAIANILAISKGMSIHHSTDQKIIVSFSDHRQALRAMKLQETQEIFHINGCPYRFSMGDSLIHSRNVMACRQVYLILRCLPLQMWTGPVVEQILSPYCALEYIDQEAKAMDDLSVFTCVARCQRAIPIPDEISIKVPQDSSLQDLAPENAAISLFLNRYTISVDKTQYIHGVTKRSKYKNGPMATATGYTVTPPECFISPRMFDQTIIQKYSSAVVLHPKPDTYFADLRHVCSFVRQNIHVRVRVKMLTDSAFLLYFAEDHPFMSLHNMLSRSFREWVSNGELDLIQWTPEYGSVGDAVTQLADLKNHRPTMQL